MTNKYPKTHVWEKRFDSCFKILSALLLVAAIVFCPKTSTWIAYSTDGVVISGATYQMCQTKSRYIYGKCNYVSLLFGLGTGMTKSEPAFPERFEGVKIEEFQDGKCEISAKTNYSRLFISHEKNRSDPGSGRYNMQKNIKIPVLFFSVKHGPFPEQSITYREPNDLIAFELEPFHGRSDSQYIGEGWFFSEEHDQIVRLKPAIYDAPNERIIVYEREDVFTDKAQVSSYEKEVISRAFEWRDEQLSDFSSSLKMSIPKNCSDMR